MPVHHHQPDAWTGRSDREDGPHARRFHHLIAEPGSQSNTGASIGTSAGADSRALIGFACEAGVIRNQGRPGAAKGPKALRQALANLAVPVQAGSILDLGDIEVAGDDLEAGQEALAEHIAAALPNHQRLVVLGGGHETAYGSYLGLSRHFAKSRIGIINLDAHFDIRTPSAKGPSSGTPFAQIRALNPDRFDYLCVGVAAEANTQSLFDRAEDWGVNWLSDHALIEDPKAADRAIAELAARCDLIYLTVCLDVLPHYQAPGVSAPAVRGLPLTTVEHLIKTVMSAAQTCPNGLPLADIVELSPPHDRDQMTARTAAYLTRKLLLG